MATGNHFWLDCIAGVGVALIALAIVYRPRLAGFLPLSERSRPPADGAGRPADDPATVSRVSRAAAIKQGYTTGARRIATALDLRPRPHAHDAERADASGVTLCAVASVLVLFENRNELLFFWLGAVVFVAGSILDILDGALARAGGKTTPFGAFLDSTTDRVSEGFMLAAIAYVFAPPTAATSSSPSPWPRSPGRSSSRTPAHAPRRSACAATSASARGPSGSS